jgi:DNA polymerase III sliding clamp (beta) subunit (PCNA family)
MNTLKIDAATLAADAAWIAKGKTRRTYVPVLATTHLSVTDDGLRLRITDFELFREVIVPAENAAASDVAVLVDPEKLAKFLKGAKGDALVSVDAAEGIRIEFGGRTITVGKADGDVADYPQWPEFVAADAVMVDPATIKRALSSVGRDGTLPMLTGVRFDAGNMVTTDRFRLSRIEFARGGEFDALVPREPLQLFTVGKGGVLIEFGKLFDRELPSHGDKRVRVSRDGRSVVAFELDAQFPKYRQLIPTEFTIMAGFRKADMLAALAGESVDLTFDSLVGTITVSGRERDGGVVVSQAIAADVVHDDPTSFTIRACSKYVADALKGIDADLIEFGGTTPSRADGVLRWRGSSPSHASARSVVRP